MGTSLLNWSWSTQHVQTEVTNSEYLSGEHTLLLAGPPRLSQLKEGNNGAPAETLDEIADGSNSLFPIGLMANFAMNQNRNLRSIFEIGSIRRYIIAEKIFSSVRMSRVKFFGPSLLRVLYAYYPSVLTPGNGRFASEITGNQEEARTLGIPTADGTKAPGYGDQNADVVGASFGQENTDSPTNNRDFWINLQSIVFRQPLGIGLYLKASNNRPYGACYLEEMMLGGHMLNIDADQIVMQEMVDAQFDRIVPIKLVAT